MHVHECIPCSAISSVPTVEKAAYIVGNSGWEPEDILGRAQTQMRSDTACTVFEFESHVY